MRALCAADAVTLGFLIAQNAWAQHTTPTGPAASSSAAPAASSAPPAAPTPPIDNGSTAVRDAVATSAAVAAAVAAVPATVVHYCLPLAPPGLGDHADQPLSASTFKCTSDRDLPSLIDYSSLAAPIGNGDTVVVFVDDGSKPLSASNITDVTYSIKSSPNPSSCQNAGNSVSNYFVLCKVQIPSTASAGDQITFAVSVKTGALAEGFSLIRKPVSFSLAGSAGGFWLPIGMFGTDFKSNSDGITLAALPVGVAWGGQLFLFNNNTDYLGLSAFASWTIAPQKASDGTNTGNYSLSGISPGAFLDIDGYVYLGYAYAADLRSGYTSPGSMFVVGMGPNLLKFLKAESTPSTPSKTGQTAATR